LYSAGHPTLQPDNRANQKLVIGTTRTAAPRRRGAEMGQWLTAFFDTSGLAPHGVCLLWRPELYWTHAISDAVIAMAYFSIPAFLLILMIRRPDLMPGWILGLFASFIVACGITHLLGLWTLWEPDYGPQALAKLATAAISLLTATSLWPQLPRILTLPSFAMLEARNRALEHETHERQVAERALRRLNQDLEERVEERTAALHDALIKAERSNRSKTVFLASMSHELRTPMNAILGFTEMLMMPGMVASEEKRQSYLAHVHESGAHLNGLIADLLDIARVESGKLDLRARHMDLREALAGPIHRAAEAAAQAGLAVTDHTRQHNRHVHADPKRVTQIIDNLLSNAIKYNRPGGSVSISLDLSRAGWAGIDISDTGIGIAEHKLNRLFIPFDRLDQDASTQPGTGLGLALSRDLAVAMGGFVTVRSQVNVGSTFTVWLPEAAGPVKKKRARKKDTGEGYSPVQG